ncbi:MAG: hypothetical protein WCW44_03660 [archaeon]|jgi:hypothetical protein
MAKKKSKPKKRFAAKPVTKVKEVPMGFFARMKDVIPQQKKETVRIKTFIVEKPVYVSAPEQRILPPAQKYQMDEEPQRKFDSRRSRYLKRKQMEADLDENSIDDTEDPVPLQKGKKQVEENFDSNEEAPLEEGEANEEGAVDEFGEPLDDETGETGEENIDESGEEEPMPQVSSHTRSRAMFVNVWWKKAIFWAVLLWLVILLIELGMQSMRLIEVDLTRQWWVVLGGLVVVLMIYFKFFEGKLKI